METDITIGLLLKIATGMATILGLYWAIIKINKEKSEKTNKPFIKHEKNEEKQNEVIQEQDRVIKELKSQVKLVHFKCDKNTEAIAELKLTCDRYHKNIMDSNTKMMNNFILELQNTCKIIDSKLNQRLDDMMTFVVKNNKN